MTTPFDLVFVGLTLSSSWGNGHATTYRALLRGLHAEGKRVLFLERDVPWYRSHRDLESPDFCTLAYYSNREELLRYNKEMRSAEAVVVGSYVPEGRKVIDLLSALDLRQLCFYDIDTPVTLASLERGEAEFLARGQVPLFDVYFSFSGGRSLDRLRSGFGARRPMALYCSVDAERYRHTAEAPRWDLGYLGTYSDDRQPVLEKLLIEPARRLPHRRFVVAGSRYPEDIDWPENVERIDHVPPDEHPSFYSCQRFTLNVTRADMVEAGWSPSVRLFEAGACATPVISDRWDGLTELLPEGEAVLLADDGEDVVRAIEDTPENRRKAIGKAARKRVLAGHTGRARARELILTLRSDAAGQRMAGAGQRTEATA